MREEEVNNDEDNCFSGIGVGI